VPIALLRVVYFLGSERMAGEGKGTGEKSKERREGAGALPLLHHD